jgi:hypothetical protein
MNFLLSFAMNFSLMPFGQTAHENGARQGKTMAKPIMKHQC